MKLQPLLALLLAGTATYASEATAVYAHVSKLKFSGLHYLGYTYSDNAVSADNSRFEIRRNYVQVKGYFFDNPKSYVRITLDSFLDNGDSSSADGSQLMRTKYTYVYLDSVLPATGVEIGLAHRPWLDYEEHAGWWHRSISKTATETRNNADFTNSADMGFNFKTKTDYFQSEIGIYNGEGYHQQDNGRGQSFEWRLTAVLTGNGTQKTKATKQTYWHLSSFGQLQAASGKTADKDYTFAGFHTVYNTPSFLIAAQYVKATHDADETAVTKKKGSFYSVNSDFRFGKNYIYQLFARMDYFTSAFNNSALNYESRNTIIGASYQMNKQVRYLASIIKYDIVSGNASSSLIGEDNVAFMLTAEVHW